MLLFSLISMMMVFNGWRSTELKNILAVQSVLLLPGLLLVSIGLFNYVYKYGVSAGLTEIWKRVPGWLIFAMAVINSLVISGLLAFKLVQGQLGLVTTHNEMVPLFSALISSFGFLIVYSLLQSGPANTYAERNKERGHFPLNWKQLRREKLAASETDHE